MGVGEASQEQPASALGFYGFVPFNLDLGFFMLGIRTAIPGENPATIDFRRAFFRAVASCRGQASEALGSHPGASW